jgi:hypothetical protein
MRDLVQNRDGGLVFDLQSRRGGFELDVSQVSRRGRHRYLP